MEFRNVWLFTIFAALITVAPLTAQVTQADSAAVLLGVARSLRAEGRTMLANSLLTLIIERYASTPAATEALQMREGLSNVPDEESGRTELLVWSTSYGLLLGALTPVAFEADSEEAVGFGLLVGGPLGYAAGRAMLGERDLSEGQARAISFGSIWGAWQGFGWARVLDIGEREVCTDFGDCFQQDQSGETLLRSSIVGSIIGVGTGLYLARKDIPAGTATTVNFGALWGTWYGGALYFLADGDGSDEDNGFAATLMGGNVGLAAMAVMAPKWQLSRGRARLISISGVAGLLGGLGILLISGAEGRGAIMVPLAGSTLGLAMGVGWTRNYDERMRTRGSEGESSSSALHWQNGKLQLALPELTLHALETRRAGKPAYGPAVRIPLFSAKF